MSIHWESHFIPYNNILHKYGSVVVKHLLNAFCLGSSSSFHWCPLSIREAYQIFVSYSVEQWLRHVSMVRQSVISGSFLQMEESLESVLTVRLASVRVVFDIPYCRACRCFCSKANHFDIRHTCPYIYLSINVCLYRTLVGNCLWKHLVVSRTLFVFVHFKTFCWCATSSSPTSPQPTQRYQPLFPHPD